MVVQSRCVATVRSCTVRMAGLALALAVAGCAETRSTYDSDYSRMAPPRQVVQAERVELEEDGLPAQLPPPLRVGKPEVPDDPSQPYSPNYGRPGIQKRADVGSQPQRRAAPGSAQ